VFVHKSCKMPLVSSRSPHLRSSARGGLPTTWSSREARSASGAFESVQRVALPGPVVERTTAGARRLGEVYWRELERSTLRLVRAHPTPGGSQLRLLGVGPPLLRFGQPELSVTTDTVGCRYPIRGGFLARAPTGAILFAQTEAKDAVELRSAISGFFPRLAARPDRPRWVGLLYPQVQARLHAALGRRYFACLWREASR
jgi:hypothetical protein